MRSLVRTYIAIALMAIMAIVTVSALPGDSDAVDTFDLSGNITSGDKPYSVGGATVTIVGEGFEDSVITGTDGMYSFTGLVSQEYELTVSCLGYRTATATIPSGTSVRDVSLDTTPIVFSGYIKDTGGKGIENVSVCVNGGTTVLTGTDGRYTAEFIISSSNSVTIHRDGFNIVSTPFDDGIDGTYVLDLTKMTAGPNGYSTATAVIMDRTNIAISGKVSSGNPSYGVPDAEVTIIGSDNLILGTTTGSDGKYSFPYVPYDVYNIEVSCKGYIDRTATYDPGAPVPDITIDPAEISLHGYVCDSNGEPLSGLNIMVNDTHESVSGANGEFDIVYEKKRVDTMVFSLNGYSIVSGGLSDVLSKSGSKYIISLDKAVDTMDGYSITVSNSDNPIVMKMDMSEYHGHVMSKEGDRPYVLSGALVEFRGNGDSYFCTSDDTGYYSIVCPSSNTYTAYVTKVGYVDLVKPVINNPIHLEMVPADIVISGIVLEFNEAGVMVPLEGASIKVNDEDKGTTDEDGMFTAMFEMRESNKLSINLTGYKVNVGGINGVLSGSDGVYVLNLNDAVKNTDGEYIVSDAAHPLILNKMSVVFSGTITRNSDGDVLPGAEITLISTEGRKIVTRSDENGRYSVECGYGNYTLTVECNGYQKHGPVNVSANQPVNNIVMQAHDSSLFFGLDLPHSLMALGIVVFGLVLLLAAISHFISKKGIGDITTDTDLGDSEE